MKKLVVNSIAFSALAIAFAAVLPAQALAAGITVGNNTSVQTQLDTYSNFTVIDTNHPVSGNGSLSTFNYYAANTNPFAFVLVDSSGVVQWMSDTITPAGVGVYSYTPSSSVPVAAGWNLGVYFTETGTIPFEYNTGAPAEWTPNGSGAPTVGSALTYESTSTFGDWVDRVYSFDATGSNCVPVPSGATPVDWGGLPVTTAAVVATTGQDVTGTINAAGCEIGVYVGPGVTGVTVKNATVKNAQYVGVYVDGGNADVTGSTVSDVGATPFNGDQYGWGIGYVTNGASGATGKVTNTQVSKYQKAGIVAWGDGTDVTLSGDTVTGNGPITYIAQNGVEFDLGAGGSLANSQISGNSYAATPTENPGDYACPDENYFASDCSQSGGVLLYDAAPGVTLSDNKVSKNDVGIWPYSDATTSPSYVVSGNTLQGNYGYGAVFDGVNGTSTNNLFQNDPVGLLVTDESASSFVTSLNDSFVSDPVNTEAIQAAPGGSYDENLIVETTGLYVHFPLLGSHKPHFSTH